jgi:amidase
MTGALATSTLLYNVLEWPVGCVPVTTVKKGEGMAEERWRGKEKEGYSRMFLDYCYGKGKMYDDIVEGGEGLPVGVQVLKPI